MEIFRRVVAAIEEKARAYASAAWWGGSRRGASKASRIGDAEVAADVAAAAA